MEQAVLRNDTLAQNEHFRTTNCILYKGNALEILRQLPDEFIDCVITSPPYWSLRDYGTEAVAVWDENPECNHKWQEFLKKGVSGGKNSDKLKVKGQENFQIVPDNQQAFCSKCGAWRGQLGHEPAFELYIQHLCSIFDEVKRILKPSGTLWVNIDDTYNNSANGGCLASDKSRLCSGRGRPPKYVDSTFVKRQKRQGVPRKSLILIPFRFAIEMVNRGWTLRNTIIWKKTNTMPESVKDRFTVDFEYVFFFTKNPKYYFEQQFEPYSSKYKPSKGKEHADRPQGRNKRCVWSIPTRPFKDAHFAVYPPELIEPMIKAGCPEGGIVLDPFAGSGTTLVTALNLSRKAIGIEINGEYCEIIRKRVLQGL